VNCNNGTIVHCHNLWKTYQQGDVAVHALNDVTLCIHDGSFVSLHGPSGSGKTTLLNLIGGLDVPSRGDVVVSGNDMAELSKAERADLRLHRLGFIFQAYNLIPVLSAQENVEFVMQLQGVHKDDRAEYARQMLKEVGLEGMENRRPGELSGGQQQRVAVARAIVGKPDMVLADEPTANLDSKTSGVLMEIMQDMNERYGVTFIFATHDQVVMDASKRLIQLTDGQIAADVTR